MFRIYGTVAFTIASCLAGCSAALAGRPPLLPADPDILTRRELLTIAGTTQNAYTAVERLRPLFLTTRPGSSIVRGTSPRVYVFLNGNFAGDVDVLRTIPLASIESIRHIQGAAAFTQYGEIRAGDGILLVQLH
jgi:hypothetical protein